FFSSCEKNIQVDTPPYTPVLVIKSTNAVYHNVVVFVSRSISIKEYNGKQDLTVKSATVNLYINGIFEETLKPQTDLFGQSYYISEHFIQPGNDYKIIVSAPGFTDAEATAVVPESVPFEIERNI